MIWKKFQTLTTFDKVIDKFWKFFDDSVIATVQVVHNERLFSVYGPAEHMSEKLNFIESQMEKNNIVDIDEINIVT